MMNPAFILRTMLPVLIGMIVLGYIIARAALLPITHDEANTCLTYSVMPVYDIITYANPVPNNHIVNTLGVKFFASIFGMHPFTVRLPNIIGFIIYFATAFLLIRKITKDPFVTFFGICVITCNPFLIDFFSLARGYALSISFMMASILFAYLFLKKRTNWNLTAAVFFAALAVYTNFTILNYYSPLIGLLALIILQNLFTSPGLPAGKAKQIALVQSGIILCITLLLAFACYIPIKKMIATDQFVYWGTNGFFKDTVFTLFYGSIYHVEYFDMTVNVFSYAMIGFAGLIATISVWEFVRSRYILRDSIATVFAIIFFGAIAVNILQFYLFQIPYLTSRTALFFYPLLAINMVLFAEWLRTKWYHSGIYFSLVLSILSIVHFSRAANLHSSFEWWYDADTYSVLEVLEREHLKGEKQITLKSNWWFYPSLNFHIVTENKDWITLAPFHEDFDSVKYTSYDYYYLNAEYISKLDSKYDTMITWGWNSRFLMRIKEKPLDAQEVVKENGI